MADIYQYIDNNPVQRNTPGIVARVEALEECGCGAITMDAPEVLQEPEALPIGASQTFKFKAAPTGLDHTTVDGIVVKIKADAYNFSSEEMIELDESLVGEWSFSTPSNYSEETKFEITVYAVDSLGNKSKQVVLEKEASLPFIRPPRITAPSANAYVYPIAGFTASTSAFGTFMAEDTHISTDWIITSDADGLVPVAQVLASSDLLSHDFTPTELSNLQTGQTYYLWARHNGETLGAGKLSASISLRSRPAGVKAPEIVTPVANSKIAFAAGVQITAGEFQTVGAEDTHASSDWKLTRDAAGQDVICQVTASSDLTSHTFPASEVGELDEGDTYYAWVRYNGTVLGNGIWASVAWEAMLGIVTPSGRMLYRHSSNEGTVIEYEKFGYKCSMLVLDAKYRHDSKIMTSSGYTQDNPDLQNYSGSNIKGFFYTDDGSSDIDPTTVNTRHVTDTQLMSLWPSFVSDVSARTNTTSWVTRYSDAEACKHCRAITTVGGFSDGFDLPTAWELMIMFDEAENIDTLDPTGSQYPHLKLGYTRTAGGNSSNAGRFYFGPYGSAWSSTENNSHSCRTMYYNGNCYFYNKNTAGGVLPIRELSRSFNYDQLTYRNIYRHPTLPGSVIEYNEFGVWKKLFVADAVYRSRGDKQWKTTNAAVSGLKQWEHKYYIGATTVNTSTGWTELRSVADLAPYVAKMSDAYYQAALASTLQQVLMSAKEATDKMIADGNCPAAQWCRSQSVGIELQLPNIYQELVMYSCGDYIDNMDPTVASYPNNALGKYTNSYRWFSGTDAWSSTENSDLGACYMSYSGCTINYGTKNASLSVAPVAEI